MPRHIRPEIFHEPVRSAINLVITVVVAGNQQRRDFKPDVRFVPEIFQSVEHRRELRKTKPMIKRVSERLEIDIRRVHVAVEFPARVIGDVARSDCHRFDAALAARLRHIDGVLGEDHRVIVGERDRSAPEPLRCERDLLGRRGVG